MRNVGTSLLDRGDAAMFDERGRRFRRSIEPVTVDLSRKTAAPKADLEAEIQSQLGKAIRGGGRWSRAMCIEVRENDGMSWSAETVRVMLAGRYPGFDIFAIRNEAATDRLPVISTILGPGRLLRLAVKHGLAEEYPTLWSWRSMLLIVLTIALVFAKQLTDLIVRDVVQHPGPNMAATLAYALLAAAIVTVIAQWLVATRPVLSMRRSEEKFRASLPDLHEKSEYGDFVEELARTLAVMSEPRFVIIDNYEALDEVTQDAVQRYFAEHHARAPHNELWIVFEGEGGDRLSAHALAAWANESYLRPLLYRQQLLTADERRDLAERVKHPAHASFSTVKAICRKGTSETEFIEKLIEPLRSKHESSLTLPYFYLLAMEVPDLAPEHRESAIGANVHFSWEWLGEKDRKDSTMLALDGLTAEEATIRAKVLAAFFKRSLRKSDVNSVAREIRSKLAPLIVETAEKRTSAFAVTREAALYLFDSAARYELPDPAIAKLFWAFTLYQRKNASRAFWARRIIHHVLEIDLARLPEALTRGVVMTELRNMALGMIDSALKCGLFGEVPELIRFTRLLITDYDGASEASFRRLRRLAWQAYHLTGAEDVLRELIQTYPPPDESVPAPALTPLQQVFAQSVALVPDMRALLEAHLLSEKAKLDGPDAYDYALARACWLTLQAAPFLASSSEDPRSFGIFDLTGIRETVKGLAERATRRLSAGGEDVSTLDVATLSLAVWCTALTFDSRVLECCFETSQPRSLLWSEDAEVASYFGRSVVAAMAFRDELVPLAQNAVIVASQYLATARRGGAPHFIAGAMVNETCAVALAATWLGHVLLQKSSIAAPDLEPQIQKLLGDVDETLGTKLAGTVQPLASGAARAAIADLLRVASMVWHRFALDRFSEFTTLRYVHFAFTVQGVHADDEERQRPLLAAIEPLIREQHFSGIAANLTLADCLRESAELSAIYLQQAAQFASETLFGDDLQSALAVISVLNARGRGESIRPLVETILRSDGNRPAPVASFLAHVPDQQLIGASLRLVNAAKYADKPNDPSILLAVADAIRRRIASAEPAEVRNEVEAMLDYFTFEAEIKTRAVDANLVLAQWASRQHLWTYPSVIHELRRAGLGGTDLRDEAMKILNRNPESDRINSWYHLAMDVAQEVEGDSPALDYVRRVVRRFEDIEVAETNMEAYSLLYSRSPQNVGYATGVVKWQKVKIRRDNIQKLPLLLEQKKFFLIFIDHFEHMRVWGLPIDIAQPELFELRRQPLPRREEWLAEWMSGGGRIPEPFVTRDSAPIVSSRFVILGEYLFDPPFDEDPRFAAAQTALNERARTALPRLLEEVVKLSHTPPEIRSLLHSYAMSRADPGILPRGE